MKCLRGGPVFEARRSTLDPCVALGARQRHVRGVCEPLDDRVGRARITAMPMPSLTSFSFTR